MTRLPRSAWAWLAVPVLLRLATIDLGSRWAWIGPALFLAGLAVAAVRQPAVAVALVVGAVAYNGGLAVLVAAPVVLLLGHRAARTYRAGPVPGQRAWLAAAVVLVALATLPFARLGYERSTGGSAGSDSDVGRAGADAPGENDWLAQLLARLLRTDEHDDQSLPWWWLIALAVVFALVVGVVVWLLRRRRHRRRSGTGAGAGAASAVARLEAVGRRAGRRRRADEGVLSYASSLAARTGDDRLATTGPDVSALVYRSAAASEARVEQALGALEASPPPVPPRPTIAQRWRERRSRLVTRRAGLTAVGAVAGVGLLAVAGSRLSTLGSGPDPSTLWSEPASAVEGWLSCESFEPVTVARAGIDHRTLDRSATDVRMDDGEDTFGSQDGLWDGEAFVDYGEQVAPIPADLYRPRLPFADLDAVLAAFAVTDPVVSTHRDAAGDAFTRYESLPLGEVEPAAVGVEELGGRWETGAVWVLDVWLGADGRPARVRQMVGGEVGRFEWLRLTEPAGAHTPPPCSGEDGPAGPWLGSEPWTRTLEVPLVVAFDSEGHPYEPGVELGGAGWSRLGELSAPTGRVAITSLEAMVPDFGWLGPSETITLAAGTVVEVDHFGSDDEPGAHRIRLAPAVDVERWRRAAELDLFESVPVVAVAVPDPDVDGDRVVEIYREMVGQARGGYRVDVDQDGEVEAMVLAGLGDVTQLYLGEDARGRVVELAVVDEGVPWRVVELPGEAPAEVLTRERELAECVAGTRPIGPDGVCQQG